MAKRLIITLALEDEENWRDQTMVRRMFLPREIETLRGGPKPYIEAEAGRMWDQLQAAEKEAT